MASTLYCSFCGKSQHEVAQLVAAHNALICGECVALCQTLLVKGDNKHPVDELFCIRRDIARLEKREKELKALVLDMAPAERQGRDAEAAVVTSERTALDTKAIKDEMGEEWVAARSKTTPVTTLKVREL